MRRGRSGAGRLGGRGSGGAEGRAVGASRGVAPPWRRRGGRSPLHNPPAAALRAPRAARPPGPPRRPDSAPARPASAARARPPPARAAAPPGGACPLPPFPHPAAGRDRSPSTLPHTTMPGAAASSGLAGPGAPAPPHSALAGPGGGREGVTPPRRAAVHARPALKEGGPARSAADPALPLSGRAPQPRPAPSGRSLAPPPPAGSLAPPPAGGGQLCARSRVRLAPPHPHSLPRGARARSA